jgi:large subunit ribosomal protein L28
VALAGGVTAALSADEELPRVVMYGTSTSCGKGHLFGSGKRKAGGRRKRLGVSGRVCMLTGVKKFKGFYRTYTEHKNVRYYRPNTHWKRLWWDEEKMWVRLYVSTKALRMVDDEGLQAVATKAGLDLYAWTRPHWMAGSRQPLPLKVGYTNKAKAALKYWPDYEDKLNKGKPLADICPAPTFTEKALRRTSAHAPNNGQPAKLDITPPKERSWKKAKRLSTENRLRLEAFEQS